jgi:hypothetical protein
MDADLAPDDGLTSQLPGPVPGQEGAAVVVGPH